MIHEKKCIFAQKNNIFKLLEIPVKKNSTRPMTETFGINWKIAFIVLSLLFTLEFILMFLKYLYN